MRSVAQWRSRARSPALPAPWRSRASAVAWESTSSDSGDKSGEKSGDEEEGGGGEGNEGKGRKIPYYRDVEFHKKAWDKRMKRWGEAEGAGNSVYTFGKPEPDYTACLLSDASKEKMYQMHKENPEVNSVDKLAAEYRIRKQRVHAILWLKELEKEEEARLGHPLDDSVEKFYENMYGTVQKAQKGERHTTDIEIGPDGWEGKSQDQALREQSEKEERILVEEFERRMEFNKKQIYGFVKTHIMSRRRPIDGWSYMVEDLGLESKRGRSGGIRSVTEPDGTRRTLNEEERMWTKRERVVARRKP
ncbi:uncharacterized protein LOC9635918 [Selaginella moellendorffii]|uniref:uncharacterized protein LOC9635918 n=1 Tax=Selaginella moellendorffii TaxID=88036 RepID=UPI000D1C7DD9|nr:uncharacterized protein LOC9635918 [Selaginella moellendorffii]|eukprot:XP_002982107.2 uncharacterized protein LOC9635918 [Selaginella moellendorffii]